MKLIMTCRKCKSVNTPIMQARVLYSGDHRYSVVCSQCGYRGQTSNTMFKATRSWNEKNKGEARMPVPQPQPITK